MGFSGHVNDRLVLWLQSEGATSDDLNDAWLEMLASKGYTGQLNDAWYALLGFLGYTGQLNDRELAFWLEGGNIP